jgi:hypothetical protein
MVIFVNDLFKEDYPGGAELTSEAIIEGSFLPVMKIRSGKLSHGILSHHKDKYWVFGNISALSDDLLLYISQNLNYSVIEYDYKFCSYRSPEKHAAAATECDCRMSAHGKTISIFFSQAKHLWFMSEGQKKYYCDLYPFLNKETTRVLSSVFDRATLKYLSEVDINNKSDKWLIQSSPSWIKGTKDSIAYAKENKLNYEIFENLSYDEMLAKFAASKGFITFPKGMDTCPRTAIEAKLLGCEIISNKNVQHRDEAWFQTRDSALEYLKNRAKLFWKHTLPLTPVPLPTIQNTDKEEKVHFKIIIPVYNASSWISNCVSSVLEQEYSNYECVVCDDISTDDTYETALSLIEGVDNCRVIKNTEKKFALKNIYDAIALTNPSPSDVIVVLDGDDWFSTRFVLGNLSSKYSQKGCWMTYGSFVEYPTARIGAEATSYGESTIKNNSFRKDAWRASHLKTFKFGLWDRVKKEDLLDDDGDFYEMTYDQAMMLPMLEMSGERSLYIPEITYVYNVSNPNAVNKTRAQKQHDLMLKIRAKQKYERLKDEDLS